jgi:negative regulator of sigma E activity
MNEASRLLDGDLSAEELVALLERMKHDADLRDEVSTQQLVRDSLRGLRTLDAGYTLGILQRLRQASCDGNSR